MSSALVWHCIRDGNSFMKKTHNGEIFSTEAGNLFNKHSYKYSGICNGKTVDLQPAGDVISMTVRKGSKTANQPKKATQSYTIKKGARRTIGSISKQVSSYRPDLTGAAKARIAAIAKSLRVKKALAK
eukprot:gene28659-31836_t